MNPIDDGERERALDELAPVVLDAFVEMLRETSALPPEARDQDERTKYALLRVAWDADPEWTAAIRGRLLPMARSLHGEDFARWLEDLFDRCEPGHASPPRA